MLLRTSAFIGVVGPDRSHEGEAGERQRAPEQREQEPERPGSDPARPEDRGAGECGAERPEQTRRALEEQCEHLAPSNPGRAEVAGYLAAVGSSEQVQCPVP